jgi:acetyl esterase/lipase
MKKFIFGFTAFCMMVIVHPQVFAQSGQRGNAQQQVIYLWEEGKIPATTVYTKNANPAYFDPPNFRPNMVYFPAKQSVKVKGAVLVCPGGSFQFRSENEGAPVAEQLGALGYQSFVVNYRLRPYTMQEGALDLARAVRHVRNRAEEYNIDANDIAVMGFSAGGILCGEMLLNFDGFVDGRAIDRSYVPDELDKISADACAVAMVYGFYSFTGSFSTASTDVEKFRAANLPPAYFVYGTRDTVNQFVACAEALKKAGVPVESRALQGWPHGFGVGDGKWILGFDNWLTSIMG